jgi:Tfp pilus assembly protein PilV
MCTDVYPREKISESMLRAPTAQPGFVLFEVGIAVFVFAILMTGMLSYQSLMVRYAYQAQESWQLLIGGRNELITLGKEGKLRAGKDALPPKTDEAQGIAYTVAIKKTSDQSVFHESSNLRLVELTAAKGPQSDRFIGGFYELPKKEKGDKTPSVSTPGGGP